MADFEEIYMWISLGFLVAASIINREGLRLLDEAKEQADLWEAHRSEAERISAEAIITFDNAQRIRERWSGTSHHSAKSAATGPMSPAQ